MSRPQTQDRRHDVWWQFLLKWVLASGLGGVVGRILMIFVGFYLGIGDAPRPLDASGHVPLPTLGDFVVLGLMGASEGLVLGLAQWLVLRRRLAGVGWWIAASTIGYAIVPVLLTIVPNDVTLTVGSYDLLPWAMEGAVSGSLQWLVLRKQLPYAVWWIPASVLAAFIANRLWQNGGPTGLLAWAFAGVVTGALVTWLFARATPAAAA